MLCAFFFFNDTATTEIYTLSLHDALPILLPHHAGRQGHAVPIPARGGRRSHVAALRRRVAVVAPVPAPAGRDRKSTRLNSSHSQISSAAFCLKKKSCPSAIPRTVRHLRSG